MNWKGELIQAFTFWGLPLFGGLAALFALRTARFDGLTRRHWAGLAAALFLFSRVGTHLLVFHGLGWTGGGDLQRVWTPAAEAVLAGEDPVRHLDNLYGPLFPYVLGLGLAWSGGAYPPGIDLPFLVADGFSLFLLWRIALRHMDETLARRMLLAVLLSPLLWFDNTVQTQEESLFVLMLLLTLDLLQRGKERSACVAAAMGTMLTKALFPFWVFPVLLAAGGGGRRMCTRVVSAGALTVGMLAFSVVLGWNPLAQFGDNINVYGSSTWLLFMAPKSASPELLRAGLLITAALCTVAGFVALPRSGGGDATTGDAAARGVVAVQGTYVLLTPFLLSAHLVHGLPFLAWQAVREGACAVRPGVKGALLALGFTLWQVPSLSVRAEIWYLHPWLIAAFAAYWGWTVYLAVRGARGVPMNSERPVPAR